MFIGNACDDWLCLVEWLAQRGALKVVVGLETYSLTPTVSRKFNIFLDRYKGITVQLVSQSLLDTEQSAYDLLKSSIATYPLAAVFFLSGVSHWHSSFKFLKKIVRIACRFLNGSVRISWLLDNVPTI